MIKIILHGCNGKMGKVLQEIISASKDCVVVAGIDRHPGDEVDFPVFESPDQCDIQGDVIIDFSHHSATKELLDYCVGTKTPVVVATTALGEAEKQLLKEVSEYIPVFNSFNMSLGINVIAKVMEMMMSALEEDFNVEIVEKHHNQKVDSPSGTALLLADAINDACKVKKEYIYGRHSKSDECKITDLGIHAVRGGTIPGEHTIIFAGPDEVIEVTHTALSRNIFARGALKAAKYISGMKNGLYSMKEMI